MLMQHAKNMCSGYFDNKVLQSHIILCFVVLLQTPEVLSVLIPPQSKCDSSYRRILTKSLVEVSATYFVDNPQVGQSEINPNLVETSTQLFETFYGKSASSVFFKKVILQMLYSDPGTVYSSLEDGDHQVLRDNIGDYIKAHSYQLAREKFGTLLYMEITDRAWNSTLWHNKRCLEKQYINETKNIISSELENIRNLVGEKRFGAFMGLGVGKTLAFVIDISEDSSPTFADITDKINVLLKDLKRGKLDYLQSFVLVFFNNGKVVPPIVTYHQKNFKRALNESLRFDGERKKPGLVLTGILQAIENSQDDSVIYVITNNEAADWTYQVRVMTELKLKNIQVVLLGRSINNTYRNSLPVGIDLYNKISGNKTQPLDTTDLKEPIIKRQGAVTIHLKTLPKPESVFDRPSAKFYIDSSISDVFFEIGGGCRETKLRFCDNKVSLSGSNICGQSMHSQSEQMQCVGLWSIEMRISGCSCEIKVTARSTLGFVVTMAKKNPDEPNTDFIEKFTGNSLFTDNITILIDFYGKHERDNITAIELAPKDDSGNYNYEDIDERANEFRIKPPPGLTSPFFVIVRGIDRNGHNFVRYSDELEFVDFGLDCMNAYEVVRPGDSKNITVNIRNNGNISVNVTLEILDGRNYFKEDIVRNVGLIEKGRTASANFLATVERRAPIGSTSLITIIANSNSNPLQYKTACRIVVGQPPQPTVESFEVNTIITSSVAETKVISTVYNDATQEQETEFKVLIPRDAFITNYSVTFQNQIFVAKIQQASEGGSNATVGGISSIEPQEIEPFVKDPKHRPLSVSSRAYRAALTMPPKAMMKFQLTYQEHLQKRSGKYMYGVTVRLDQPVGNFLINISIHQTNTIQNPSVLGFDTEQRRSPYIIPIPVTYNLSNKTMHVTYSPSSRQQESISPFGLKGKFLVEYEVDESPDGSEMKTAGREFVHFVHSSKLKLMKTRVVFVLDMSGSMHGEKLKQLRTAMRDIIDLLHEYDRFSIIIFNNAVNRWKPTGIANNVFVPATIEYKQRFKQYLSNLTAMGGSNPLKAMEYALSFLANATENEPHDGIKGTNPVADYVVLLSDGRPTDGEKNDTEIINKLSKQNRNLENKRRARFAIHTIGFGVLADVSMLRRLAIRNQGNNIQVFLNRNSHSKIVDFFHSIAYPLLHDITIKYSTCNIANSSRRAFQKFYSGSELIISGLLRNNSESCANAFTSGRKKRAVSNHIQTETIPFTLSGKRRLEEENTMFNTTPQAFPQDLMRIAKFFDGLEKMKEIRRLNRRCIDLKNEYCQKTVDLALKHNLVVPGITALSVSLPRHDTFLKDGVKQRPVGASPPTPTTVTAESSTSSTLTTATTSTTTIIPNVKSIKGIPPDGEVVDDPRVILYLDNKVVICFRWNGNNNEVHNLVDDDILGVFVNAKIIKAPNNRRASHRTYIGELGFVFEKEKVTVEINVSHISITFGFNMPLQLVLTKENAIERGKIAFQIFPISHFKTEVYITLDVQIQFKIVTRVNINERTTVDHLDFYLVQSKGFSTRVRGVLGQFYTKPENEEEAAKILPTGDPHRAILSYRKKLVPVLRLWTYHMSNQKREKCWRVININEIAKNIESKYLRSHLLQLTV